MTDVTSTYETTPPSARWAWRSSTLGRIAQAAPALTKGFGWTVLFAIGGTAGLVGGPLVLQRVLDQHLLVDGPIDTPGLLQLGAFGLAIALAGALLSRVAVLRMAVAAADGIADLRLQTLGRLHAMPLHRVGEERRGALLARVTSDLDVVTEFIGWGGVGMLVGVARLTAATVALAVLRWELAVIATVIVFAYGLFLAWAQRRLARAHDGVRGTVADSLGAVSEAIAGFVTVRSYGVEDQVRAKVGTHLAAQFDAEYRAGALGAVLFGSAELFSALLTASIVGVGLVVTGLTVGELVAALFLVALLTDPVQTVVETLNEAQSALAGLRRVTALLDEATEDELAARPAAPRGEQLPTGALGIAIDGLTFAYPTGPPVLQDVTVTIPPRTRVALVGETGSGKTTLAKILARLLVAGEGEVRVGDVDLSAIDRKELRDRVGFVPQEGFLFDATVRENLRRAAPDASDERLEAQARRLGLDGWVAALPDGLDTPVGERGTLLSAGERQLVALWRAALLGPDLLVLDEATSAVDPRLEVQLRAAIERLSSDRTVVTVAHRLSTAEAADLVLVLDHGVLVEQGSHAELLTAGGVYAGLHADWMAGSRA